MLDPERRAAGGDRGRHACEVAGHDIGVALDDDHLLALRDVAPGEIEPVEHLALVVHERLGGVEVLRPLVLVVAEQLARAEADGLSGDVADGPDQPAAESVVRVTAVARGEQTGCRQLLEREALRLHGIPEGVERLGREADAEVLGRGGVEAARAEEVAADLGGGRAELRLEPLLGGGVRRQQPGAVAVVARLAAVLVVQLVAEPGGQPLHGFGEGDVVHLLQEREDVAALVAAEAVVQPDLGPHVEGRAALLVERAEPLHRADARALERDEVAHDVGDVGAGPDFVDVASTNQTGHGSDSRFRRCPTPVSRVRGGGRRP